MNYFVFLSASEAKNIKDTRRSVYQSNYLDIRVKQEIMSEENESNINLNYLLIDDEEEDEHGKRIVLK